jgi:hypothetical protein
MGPSGTIIAKFPNYINTHNPTWYYNLIVWMPTTTLIFFVNAIISTMAPYSPGRLSYGAKTHDIQFQPSLPYAHNTVRHVERLHRTLQEMVVKCLSNKSHLSSQFWGLAYMHCVHLHNILPNRQTGLSPYFLWNNAHYDYANFPLLPFGSIIMANIPTDLQTSRSGRSKESYYVGCSEIHHGAVKLFNPITKRVTLRHSFKFLSDVSSHLRHSLSRRMSPHLLLIHCLNLRMIHFLQMRMTSPS